MKEVSIAGVVIGCLLIIAAGLVAGDTPAAVCPRGYKVDASGSGCVDIGTLVEGRADCSATLTDYNTKISVTCPTLGTVVDADNGYSLKLQATKLSTMAAMDMTPSTCTRLTASDSTQYDQITSSMTLADFQNGCDVDSMTEDIDVLHSQISLLLLSTQGGNVDTLLTVNYRIVVTINRAVTSSTGIYFSQTLNGGDITVNADALQGYASWCTNGDACPSSCVQRTTNVFPIGSQANMFFGIQNSGLPSFVKKGSCYNWKGEQVWEKSSDWVRNANGAGMASVSFIIPSDIKDCTWFTWTCTVMKTFNAGFKLQNVDISMPVTASAEGVALPSNEVKYKFWEYSDLAAQTLNITVVDSDNSTSTTTIDISSSTSISEGTTSSTTSATASTDSSDTGSGSSNGAMGMMKNNNIGYSWLAVVIMSCVTFINSLL